MGSTRIVAQPGRTSTGRFLLWLAPFCILVGIGLFATTLCLVLGLSQTNMDNRFAFGLWIFLDLTVIALGAGAFFSGFLFYVLRVRALRSVIGAAVVLGFICYSGAVAILGIDVGQPLRAWFTFWHPNVHSMLTEVTFCITCYLTVLAIEYVPLLLRQRQLRREKLPFAIEHEMHRVMVVFALIGTGLSFFHQGSLGGLFGVLRGRPFAFREGVALWPSTFVLFVLSAIAVGPAFLALVVTAVEKLSRRALVRPEVLALLGKISGLFLAFYVALKAIDTLVWINATTPAAGANAYHFYRWQPFGSWILFTEIVLCGLVPALMLLSPRVRARRGLMLGAALLACIGVALNRLVMTLQTLSLPTLAVDPFLSYRPSWQELAVLFALVGYGVILFSLSYRYLPLFPDEHELALDKRGA